MMRHFSHIFFALGRTFTGHLSCWAHVPGTTATHGVGSEDPTTVTDP